MNKQNKIIVGVVALILALTIGYAVFSQSLNIKGTAKAEGKLDIIFSEVGEIVSEGANKPTTTITEEGRKLELGDISLDYPTAYVEVPVTIVNNGTVDGVLEGITVENLETDDIKVTINGVENNQIVKMHNVNDETTKVKATIRVEWLDKADTKTESVKNISITLNAKQLVKEVVTTKDSSTSKCTEFTKKDTYSVGDMISFCNASTGKSEDFYVIKDNGDTVTALAKYSLLVGNSMDFTTGDVTVISNDTNDYGLQSEKTVFYGIDIEGGKFSSTLFNGEMSFSNNRYWLDDSDKLLTIYKNLGTEDTPIADVYDENSLMYTPIQNYISYFKTTLGKTNVLGRLITKVELDELGCDDSGNDCMNAPDWISSTMYASGTARGTGILSVMGKNEYSSLSFDNPFGVRPVITISKSEI